jgi:hypothetical protein
MPDARFPAAGSPPGRSSQRADLSPAAAFQPQRIPTGQPYGSAKQVEQMQASRPLRDAAAQPTPGGGGPPGLPVPNAAQGAFGGGGLDPAQVLATVSGHPTQRPGEPITAGVQTQPLGAGFKLDVLRHIATLPFAGPEIQQLVQKAYIEANVGNNGRIL